MLKALMLTVEPYKGAKIADVCTELVDLAKRLEAPIITAFNDILITAYPDSRVDDLLVAWSNAVVNWEAEKARETQRKLNEIRRDK